MKNFKNCLQKEIPFCAAVCPFHLDILDFIEKMKRGGQKGAFKTYRNAVGFPIIASTLCHEPCKGVCPRKDMDSAIELKLLEKACISFTGDSSPTDYNLPMKKKKVAVIGAGISGLACALRLCMKKYEVEIFEKTDRIGGHLWELMDPELFLADIKAQFQHEKYTMHFNTDVQAMQDLDDYRFDAVYAATGDGGADFGLLSETGKNCAFHGRTGWFAGGGLIGDRPVYALANGLSMGTVIDNFLKTGNLNYPENTQGTRTCLNPVKIKYEEPVVPESGTEYNEEESKAEAARCIECQCDYCRTYCDLTEFYNKWPLRIRDEIMATTLPGSADVKATPAKRLLSTCSQCGLCLETCPEDIDLGGLILEGRRSMHRQKKVPWVFHDFWLRDMDFANGESASISRRSRRKNIDRGPLNSKLEHRDGAYAFFPGCQLGASDPNLVERTYEFLLSKHQDTGLLLRCCGAPAEWAGDEEKHRSEIETIRRLWSELGSPTLILACPTCEKKFREYMNEIPVVSLYEILAECGAGSNLAVGADHDNIKNQTNKDKDKNNKTYSVFDPCAARNETKMKDAVRQLAKNAGFKLEPLPENDALAHCCGFGGQPGIANPAYAEFVTKKRIAESDNPYIAYCINCRDSFLEAGKESVHILDLLFGNGTVPEHSATLTERRENRIKLKNDLMKKYWGEQMPDTKKKFDIKVKISPELSKKLNQERILEEDIIDVIDFCEKTGRKVYLPERGLNSGYHEIGFMTYWAEYMETHEEDTFELVNAYAHRVKIELEAVWNERKTDADLR